MRKSLAAAVAAITFTGAIASAVSPAQAHPYYNDGGYYQPHHNNGASTALIAGIAGLAIGAAIMSASHKHHNGERYGYYSGEYGGYADGYNGYGAYEPDEGAWRASSEYGGGYGYSVCEGRQVAYDPYTGEQTVVRSQYAC